MLLFGHCAVCYKVDRFTKQSETNAGKRLYLAQNDIEIRRIASDRSRCRYDRLRMGLAATAHRHTRPRPCYRKSDEIIRIVIKSDNIFDPETFREVTGLAQKAVQIKGVRRVISLPDIKRTIDGRPGEIDITGIFSSYRPRQPFRPQPCILRPSLHHRHPGFGKQCAQ
jgi:hypothetical protein